MRFGRIGFVQKLVDWDLMANRGADAVELLQAKLFPLQAQDDRRSVTGTAAEEVGGVRLCGRPGRRVGRMRRSGTMDHRNHEENENGKD
jgi:hypothetical protein